MALRRPRRTTATVAAVPGLRAIAQDVRYAVRGLRHSPGFTAAAVLSLALGIGANTAIFSLFHALMLRLLPVENPQELVSLYRTGGWGRGFVSYPLFQEVAKRTDLFTGVVARTGIGKVRFTPRPGDRGEFTQREFVSGNYFHVLGVTPAIGRLFTDDDNRTPGAHPVGGAQLRPLAQSIRRRSLRPRYQNPRR